MTHPIVIQTLEMMERRMMEQLRRRKVDVGLYSVGGAPTAQAWKEMDDMYPPPWVINQGPILDHYGEVRCVVDFGPGSGQPCLAATKAILEHVREIVLIDTSAAMLSIAKDYLQRNTRVTVTCIIADFLQDTEALNVVLNGFSHPRLFLCLGNTVGSFNQGSVLPALRGFLREDDNLLLDFGLYPDEHAEGFLKDLASKYVEGTNHFGLQFLTGCGVEPDDRCTFASVRGDDDDPAVQVVRVFYRFPKETVLTVGREQVIFKEGDCLHVLESRRLLVDRVERHLRKYGLDIVAAQHIERPDLFRGLFLCHKGASARTAVS